ncbi:Parathyroid hormone/parathyroid hormone-related peptide receptor [Trachymyrmex zeteki]|uniref:Parathyroid hormone/parathyroid hormone-related peptide receptor n=1 Tax=Mycetomoellerius zeteki TaxID=64791 RepID=A0A151X6T0_9HYME|nr:Parathyroid hormone/parathyroid hormone-related peptide receptor [Trachymyrmex zeteki]
MYTRILIYIYIEFQRNDVIDRMKLMDDRLESEAKRCKLGNILEPGWCPKIWDGILCWNSTAPGQLVVQQCASYIMGFDANAFASKQCMPNGKWYWNVKTQSFWTNFSQCYREPLVTVLVNMSNVETNNATLIKTFLPVVKTISKLGYSISLFTLIIAFCILATINLSPIGRRKLRCPRNILHMHLFVSFVMRAFMALLKDMLFVSGLGVAEAVIKVNEGYWLLDKKESNWQCKTFTSLWQYFILANYSWILMEGIYLHNLVFLALFTDANSSIVGYVIFGWGLPAIFILPWVVTRIIFQDTYCWTTNENSLLFLFIRVPTMLSILINFVLFINIVRVLLVKLKSTMSEETERYKRWARSTLVLVPLFGVHYAFFILMSYSIGVNETVEVVWLFCDQLFASFQWTMLFAFEKKIQALLRIKIDERKGDWDIISVFPEGLFRGGAVLLPKRRHVQLQQLEIRWSPAFKKGQVVEVTLEGALLSLPGSRYSSVHPLDGEYTRCPLKSYETSYVGTRGGSLASSRGYLEIAGNGQPPTKPTTQDHHPHHTSPLCSKYTHQSLLSFCSMSDASGPNVDKIRDHHRWSDSECCHLAYELHNLQQHHGHPDSLDFLVIFQLIYNDTSHDLFYIMCLPIVIYKQAFWIYQVHYYSKLCTPCTFFQLVQYCQVFTTFVIFSISSGQTSGQCVNPKYINTHCPKKSSDFTVFPSVSTNSNLPPILALPNCRLLSFAIALSFSNQFLMCSFILYFYVALKNHLFQNKSNKKLNRIVTPYLKFLQQRREIYCIFLHNVSNHIRQQSTEVIYTVVK